MPGSRFSVPTTPGGDTCPLVCVSHSAGALVLWEARSGGSACGVRVLVIPCWPALLPCTYPERKSHQEVVYRVSILLCRCWVGRAGAGTGPRTCSPEAPDPGRDAYRSTGAACVPVLSVGISDSSPNSAAPVMPIPWRGGLPGNVNRGREAGGPEAGVQGWQPEVVGFGHHVSHSPMSWYLLSPPARCRPTALEAQALRPRESTWPTASPASVSRPRSSACTTARCPR